MKTGPNKVFNLEWFSFFRCSVHRKQHPCRDKLFHLKEEFLGKKSQKYIFMLYYLVVISENCIMKPFGETIRSVHFFNT